MSKKRLTAAVGTLLLAGAMTTATTSAYAAGPAGARAAAALSRPDHSCDRGDFCVYTDYNFGASGGQTWAWQGSDTDWCYNDGTPPCNSDHSWWNHGNYDGSGDYNVVVYDYGSHDSGSPHVPTLCVRITYYGTGYDVPSADGRGSGHRWIQGGCPSGVPTL
ncbi:hypothetical protein GCM10029978_111030 [Actinoallomurus acanthiterrae]